MVQRRRVNVDFKSIKFYIYSIYVNDSSGGSSQGESSHEPCIHNSWRDRYQDQGLIQYSGQSQLQLRYVCYK